MKICGAVCARKKQRIKKKSNNSIREHLIDYLVLKNVVKMGRIVTYIQAFLLPTHTPMTSVTLNERISVTLEKLIEVLTLYILFFCSVWSEGLGLIFRDYLMKFSDPKKRHSLDLSIKLMCVA
jgi:hypothetical protein